MLFLSAPTSLQPSPRCLAALAAFPALVAALAAFPAFPALVAALAALATLRLSPPPPEYPPLVTVFCSGCYLLPQQSYSSSSPRRPALR